MDCCPGLGVRLLLDALAWLPVVVTGAGFWLGVRLLLDALAWLPVVVTGAGFCCGNIWRYRGSLMSVKILIPLLSACVKAFFSPGTSRPSQFELIHSKFFGSW